jgi:hypothetical protein
VIPVQDQPFSGLVRQRPGPAGVTKFVREDVADQRLGCSVEAIEYDEPKIAEQPAGRSASAERSDSA